MHDSETLFLCVSAEVRKLPLLTSVTMAIARSTTSYAPFITTGRFLITCIGEAIGLIGLARIAAFAGDLDRGFEEGEALRAGDAVRGELVRRGGIGWS